MKCLVPINREFPREENLVGTVSKRSLDDELPVKGLWEIMELFSDLIEFYIIIG